MALLLTPATGVLRHPLKAFWLIQAAIGLASKEFIDGNYAGARSTLLKTRQRNFRYAALYPIPVADLHRALASVSRLDGRQTSARSRGDR